MPSTPSVASGSRSVASTPFKARLLSSKPAIDIFIPNTKPFYSTLDTIVGSVTVTVRQPTPFSDISINLVGVTQCSVDNPNASGGHSSSDAMHRFLGVAQPIPEEALPLPMVLQPGQTYSFPFSFVVPAQMLPRACSHSVNSQPVRDAHLQLPPSLNPEATGMGFIFGGRMSDCVKISYSIKARISRAHHSGGHKIAIAEANRAVNIRPATEELPPLDVDAESSASNVYCLRKESTIRRGLTCTKQGRLSFTAAQPRSFRLALESGGTAASTYLRARLRFDPATDAAVPPRLGTLTSKLCATTHWATAVRHDFPGLQKKDVDRTRDEWTDMVPLASLSVENVEWTRHDPSAPAPEQDHLRPASALSSVSGLSGDSWQCGHGLPAPSGAYRDGGVFYTAQVLVPLSLPEGKACLPTFHTCLASRTYALRIALSLDRRMCSALELRVPVQVSAAGGENLAERLRQEELAAQAAGDVDRVFEPRLVSPAAVTTTTTVVVPEIRLRRTASGPAEEPPEYEVLSFGSVATRTRVAVHV
jgi:hypothetical protein